MFSIGAGSAHRSPKDPARLLIKPNGKSVHPCKLAEILNVHLDAAGKAKTNGQARPGQA